MGIDQGIDYLEGVGNGVDVEHFMDGAADTDHFPNSGGAEFDAAKYIYTGQAVSFVTEQHVSIPIKDVHIEDESIVVVCGQEGEGAFNPDTHYHFPKKSLKMFKKCLTLLI